MWNEANNHRGWDENGDTRKKIAKKDMFTENELCDSMIQDKKYAMPLENY